MIYYQQTDVSTLNVGVYVWRKSGILLRCFGILDMIGLNKLQLIKGNLDLNRIDRAKAYIDEIVIEAQHESKLSNLNLPLFASLLLRSNWEKHSFELEYEVLKDPEPLEMND